MESLCACGQTESERARERESGKRAIGTVHSTEFIQLNARRCVCVLWAQGTLLLLPLLFPMLLLFKWTCASSLFRHSLLARSCVCALGVFFLVIFQSVVLGSVAAFVLFVHCLFPLPAYMVTRCITTSSRSGIRFAFGFGMGFFDSKWNKHVCICSWAFPFDAIATTMMMRCRTARLSSALGFPSTAIRSTAFPPVSSAAAATDPSIRKQFIYITVFLCQIFHHLPFLCACVCVFFSFLPGKFFECLRIRNVCFFWCSLVCENRKIGFNRI